MEKIRILYLDERLLVAYKPAGFDSQAEEGFDPDMVSALKKELKARGESNLYIGVVHRLDKPVEGLLLYARDKGMTADLCQMIQKRQIKKYYCALVRGICPPQWSRAEGTRLENLLATDRRSGNAYVADGVCDETFADAKKAALLVWNVSDTADLIYGNFLKKCEQLPGELLKCEAPAVHYHYREEDPMTENALREDFSFVRICLETGRYHQIRTQLSHAGHPILGDRRYGQADEWNQVLRYPALCAYEIGFHHPVTGEWMTFRI